MSRPDPYYTKEQLRRSAVRHSFGPGMDRSGGTCPLRKRITNAIIITASLVLLFVVTAAPRFARR